MQPNPFGDTAERIESLRFYQESFRVEVTDSATESPSAALVSLQEALKTAPSEYKPYLEEALACYQWGQYRAAVLMVWAATVQHLFEVVSQTKKGVTMFEAANSSRYGTSSSYRQIRKVDDFLYLKESQFILLGEDAGMYNRNTRILLEQRLTLRNLCGHPTRYVPGREEVVIFIESLLLNVISGNLINWP